MPKTPQDVLVIALDELRGNASVVDGVGEFFEDIADLIARDYHSPDAMRKLGAWLGARTNQIGEAAADNTEAEFELH